jgi:hypothetical protein
VFCFASSMTAGWLILEVPPSTSVTSYECFSQTKSHCTQAGYEIDRVRLGVGLRTFRMVRCRGCLGFFVGKKRSWRGGNGGRGRWIKVVDE